MTPIRRYEFAPAAVRDLRKLDAATRQRVLDALDRLVSNTGPSDVRKLEGASNEWRLRVGDWRVRFERDAAESVITVLRVLPRGRAYRD